MKFITKFLFLFLLIGILIPFVLANDPPNVTMNSPEDNFYSSLNEVNFNCSFSDLDYPVGNLSLFGNFSGVWQEVNRYEVGSLNHLFSEIISEGFYFWSCMAEDNSSMQTFGENRTLIVDITAPLINLFELNESSSCGNTSLIVICNTSDNEGINKVLLEVSKPGGEVNLSMNLISGNYTKELFIDEVGDWNFRCISQDNAGNQNFSDFLNVESYSGFPEIYINDSRINFDKGTYIEGETVKVSAYVENIGCVASSNFNVSFFKNSVSFDYQLGLNQSMSLGNFSGEFVNLSYSGFVGRNNIFVFVDSGEEISEHNENNNVANNFFSITLWQKFYGNVTDVKILQFKDNFTSWSIDESVIGNIFVADSEAIINWLSLKALGRNIFDVEKLNDFSEVDNLFGTTNFNDSISNIYLEDGLVIQKENFFIHKKNISHVPIVNTSSNGNFVTGILWDSSDDSGDGEFSEGDKEDLVFVTKLNNGAVGEYGVYDYEIKIPVELRSYDSSDTEEVYLYYDLV